MHLPAHWLQPQSSVFPFLPLTEIERFLAERNATDETTWIRSFRAWVNKVGGNADVINGDVVRPL